MAWCRPQRWFCVFRRHPEEEVVNRVKFVGKGVVGFRDSGMRSSGLFGLVAYCVTCVLPHDLEADDAEKE